MDAQSGHEKNMTAMIPALAGSNIIYGMGMIEMGMTISYEQLLIDAEIVRMVRRIMQGITVDELHLAANVIKNVGPGGTFLSQKHTLEYLKEESSQASLFDRRTFDAWLKSGGLDTYHAANKEAKRILETYKPEPLEDEVKLTLRKIIEEAEYELKENGKP